MGRQIETTTTLFYLRDDGIIRARIINPAYQNIRIAHENISALRELCKEEQRGLLADMSFRGVSKEAREYYASPDNQRILSCVAFLTGNTISQLLTKLFLTLAPKNGPMASFTSEDKAVKWLHKALRDIKREA